MASNCQIPTPQKYVQQMLDYVDYSKKLYGKKVLENSCGEGNILLEVVKRYIESAKSEKHSARRLPKGERLFSIPTRREVKRNDRSLSSCQNQKLHDDVQSAFEG